MSVISITEAAAGATTVPAADVDELVRLNLPLVGHLVREVCARVPAHVNRDDLVSAGMYALVLAARGYDAERGVPFARFASIRIRGALTDELRSMDWASRGARSKAREIDAIRIDMAQQLGREATREELASACGISTSQVSAIETDVNRASVLSLQALAADHVSDVLPAADEGPEDLIIRRDQIGWIRDAVAELPERLQAVVVGYFFEHRKMVDIAADLGVTESRVSQLRSEALKVLRTAIRATGETVNEPAAPVQGRAAAVTNAYCAAVAARSTVAGRLAATTVLGESIATAAARAC
jgi:RNA polymerase sigma factor for flagellar operon FliA